GVNGSDAARRRFTDIAQMRKSALTISEDAEGERTMDLKLKGKKALVFGGSKGIGRGIADALAAEGVDVALVARSKETLDRSVAEINARGGGRAVGVVADLGDWPSVENAVQSARQQIGSIDILLNNSGGPPP